MEVMGTAGNGDRADGDAMGMGMGTAMMGQGGNRDKNPGDCRDGNRLLSSCSSLLGGTNWIVKLAVAAMMVSGR